MRRAANCWGTVLRAASAAAFLSAVADARPALEHRASDEAVEVAFLVKQGAADALATASLLSHLIQSDPDGPPSRQGLRNDSTELIQRAIALEPNRPELLWLQLRSCQIVRCPEEKQIAARLRAADPDNGLVLLADLRNEGAQTGEGITRIIAKIGASQNPQVYWNRLVVMMFDALTHRAGSVPATAITHDPDDRLTHVLGVMAAVDVPAFQVLGRACRSDQFAEPGRRDACARVAERLDASDSVIAQNVSMTLQQSLAAADGTGREALLRKHLQQRYLTIESNRVRAGRVDDDALVRVDAMRHLPREQDVEAAMLKVFHEPQERPTEWRIPAADS